MRAVETLQCPSFAMRLQSQASADRWVNCAKLY